jgi:hypothetical protein
MPMVMEQSIPPEYKGFEQGNQKSREIRKSKPRCLRSGVKVEKSLMEELRKVMRMDSVVGLTCTRNNGCGL